MLKLFIGIELGILSGYYKISPLNANTYISLCLIRLFANFFYKQLTN